ncbi:hypothetical protein [Sphingomonas lenta]|uniref:Uncharacterized protein n=1 Tax=Sphingomonas lenta TaxID=1141887 RepID=A0A2A2SAQ7_9SPHN|nr:hypothetical protein [Sphingomonas lenta]PAX06336.1 hypothetical protein CKY28_17815 [Sphingomonas lenta]
MGKFYITPTGSGNKSGSDWANAAAITSLDGAVRKAGSGGTVYLAADQGAYKVTNGINIWSGASFSDEVTIKGVNSRTGADQEAVIEGTRPAAYKIGNPAGNELFKFQKGAGNLHFENFQVNNTATVFRAVGDVADITIENVDADNVAHFFQTYAGSGNKTASVTDLTLRDIDVDGFSRALIYIGYNSRDVLIQDVRGDSERQDGDEFAIGVHLVGTAHDVTLRRVTMENATDTTGGNYWNGDGFATEAGVYDVRFEDTVARGNTDAGYDLKSKSTTLVRAVAEDNSRNFRIWGEVMMVDAVGLNPEKRGGLLNGQNQIHVLKGAELKIDGGYFADAGSSTRVFLNDGGIVSIADVEIVRAKTGALSAGAIGGLDRAKIELVDAVGKHSAGTPFTPTDIDDDDEDDADDAPAPATPAPTGTIFVGTARADGFAGTAAADQFHFDAAVNRGADRIAGFGSNDALVTRTALADGNRDGIIGFGANGTLELGGGAVKFDGPTKGLRLLGQTDDGFFYGDAAVRPTKAVEGRLSVGDKLVGDAKDKVANRFFFDTALGLDLGDDKVVSFGAKDVLMTTSRLGEGARVAAGRDGSFAFGGDADLGGVKVTDTTGRTVAALELDGVQLVGGVQYFVYSLLDG